MKKIVLFVVFGLMLNGLSAQVFNTGQTLKPGTFAVGVEPLIITSGGATDFMLFGHVGYGLKKGIDIAGKVGILGGTTYVGADVEFGLTKYISLGAGAHVAGDFGLDATLLGTYSIKKGVDLYGGLDADINLGGNVFVPIWIPVGVEIGLRESLTFVFEASIGVVDAPHLIGGGVMAYF